MNLDIENDTNINDGAPLNYSPDISFDAPLRVRGTNRLLRRNSNTMRFEFEDASSARQAVTFLQQNEDMLVGTTIAGVAQLDLVCVNNEGIVLKLQSTLEQPERFFFIDVRETAAGFDSYAVKAFLGVLKVPASYARINPKNLNQVNISYHLDKFKLGDQDRETRILHTKNTIQVQVPPSGDEHNIGSFNEPAYAQAYQILDLVQTGRKRRTDTTVPHKVDQNYGDFYPKLSSVVQTFLDQVSKQSGEDLVRVPFYGNGFQGQDKQHSWAKLIIDTTGREDQPLFKPFSLSGSPYHYGITVQLKVLGEMNPKIEIQPSLFRYTCKNVSSLTQILNSRCELDQVKEQLQLKYIMGRFAIDNKLNPQQHEDAVSSMCDCNRLVADRVRGFVGEAYDQYRSEFNQYMGRPSISLSLNEVNSPLLKYFIEGLVNIFSVVAEPVQEALKSIEKVDITKADPDEFISYFESLSKSYGLSPELTKLTMMEYVGGVVIPDSGFKNPLDVVNYMTFISQSLDAPTAHKVEGHTMDIAQMLADRFSREDAKPVRRFDHYRALLNTLQEPAEA